MKKQNGITLIALIITIIVMLILVGVSVTVALNGGLFKTAKDAAEGTKLEGEKEQLLSIVLGALDDKGIVDYGDLDETLAETDFEGEAGTYTSKKTRKKYIVNDRGSITEGITWTAQGELAIGSKVKTSTGEVFYVIGGDETGTEITNSTENVILLAEYCIVADKENKDYLKQSPTAEGVYFSNVVYWGDEFSFPIDLNKYEVPEEFYEQEVTSIITIAKEYGEKFKTNGVKGRLMTFGEVQELGELEEHEDGYYVTSVFDTNGRGFINSVNNVKLLYWLGYAESPYDVAIIDGEYYQCASTVPTDVQLGVRPVIEVPKSAIQ